MYLPAYRAGTEKVAALRQAYPASKVLPALFGCRGVVDLTTIEEAVAG
jgi:predicted RecB family endonuclease